MPREITSESLIREAVRRARLALFGGSGTSIGSAVGGVLKSDYAFTPDGIETDFATSLAFVVGSTRVFLNGLRQLNGTDYTELGTAAVQFLSPPETGDNIIIDYVRT